MNYRKKGEPKDHFLAKWKLLKIFRNLKWKISLTECRLTLNWQLTDEDKKFIYKKSSYDKQFDLFCVKLHDKTGLISELIIEIDGTIHDKDKQKKKDNKAKDIISFLIPDIFFIRLDKNYVLENDDTDIIKRINYLIKKFYKINYDLI